MKYICTSNLKLRYLYRYYVKVKDELKHFDMVVDCNHYSFEEMSLYLSNECLKPFVYYICILKKYNILSDKYLWTLNLLILSLTEKKYRLPVHTLREYCKCLRQQIENDKSWKYKLFLKPLLIEITDNMEYWLNKTINDCKDYYKPPKIKEPEFIKISKSNITV